MEEFDGLGECPNALLTSYFVSALRCIAPRYNSEARAFPHSFSFLFSSFPCFPLVTVHQRGSYIIVTH